MSERTLRIGTRGSALALAQSGMVADALTTSLPQCTVELVRIRTKGDDDRAPLTQIGGTGVFVATVREALLAGEIDAAVHSFKDLPTADPDGLVLAAVPDRAEARDALCARDGLTVATLPPGARVGTGSPRRAAQLLRARPDLHVVPIRGNVDTRLAGVHRGDLDAVVLAAAGLTRLGRIDAMTELLGSAVMLPAPAQGALAVECRTADRETSWFAAALRAIDDPPSRAAVLAERAMLARLEAGCAAPVGALAAVSGDRLILSGGAFAVDGSRLVRDGISGTRETPAELGIGLAERLLARGAAELLAVARSAADAATGGGTA